MAESVGITSDGSLKASLRAELQARRDAIPLEARTAAANAVAGGADRFVRSPARVHSPGQAPSPALVVAGYWPIRSEIDPRPLLEAIRTRGAVIVLPVLVAGTRLVFREWPAGAELAQGRFGTREPLPSAAERVPDCLIVPVVAFTRAGDRLGYGAGYYDRSLPALARQGARTVGLAFAAQEAEQLPREPHDWPLDAVLTESAWIDCRRIREEAAR